MIPCKCGEPTCDFEDNAAKVERFCAYTTIELVRETHDGDLAARVTGLELSSIVARLADVPFYVPYVRVKPEDGGTEGIFGVGYYHVTVDVGEGRGYEVACWILSKDGDHRPVGEYAITNSTPLNPRGSAFKPTPQPVEEWKGIPNHDATADWGADDFWVRTTESLVADILAHRKMLDDKIARLTKELAAAEAERGTFAERIADAADGLSYPTP